MKVVFSESYLDRKEAILQVIEKFPKGGEVLKEGGRNTLKCYQIDDLNINIKAFRIPNVFNKLAYRFVRKSKAERSFTYAERLLAKGIGTPAPIAYMEETTALVFGRSFYVSEQLQPDLTFRKLIRDPDFPNWETILRQFTAFTYRLHENRILFKDHSPGNTLIKYNGADYDFFLVDLNRMEFKELTFEERIKNFSRLTPKKEMIQIMSEEYAKLTSNSTEKVFAAMWSETEKFQYKFHRKKKLKKHFLFWR